MNPHNIPTLKEIEKWIAPPAFLLSLIKDDDEKSETYELPELIKGGTRKTQLFKFAASLRARGMELPEIEAALWGIVPRCENSEEVKDADIKDILRSIGKYDKGSSVPMELPETLEPTPPNKADVSDADSNGDENYVIALGHSSDKYYFTSNSNRQIVTITASNFSLNSLLNLQTHDYWQEKFPKTDNANPQIDLHQATNFLMRKAREKGIFASGRLRGRGVWRDRRRTVLHCGNAIFDLQSQRSYELGRFETDYIYELGQSYEPPFQKDRHPKSLLELTSKFNWTDTNSPYILAGWIAIARFSGWLRWRPHIWITGQKGTGKSTVIDEFLKNLLGLQSYYFEGGSTAAGIRQEIQCDAVPIIFNEAETSDQKTGAKIKSILELARQASSDSDGYICKGTPSGNGLKYKMSSMFCLASIRVNLQEEQDKSRFSVLELSKNTVDNWPVVSSMLQNITPEDGEAVFTKMAGLVDELDKNINFVTDTLAGMNLERRLSDQYGTLLGGLLTYEYGRAVGENEVGELLQKINLDNLLVTAESDFTDSDDCLATILQCRTNCSDTVGRKLTVSGIIKNIRTNPSYEQDLATYGMATKEDRNGKLKLFISNKNTELAKLLRETPWGNHMWKDSLLRLEGSCTHRMRVDGINCRGVVVTPDIQSGDDVPF